MKRRSAEVRPTPEPGATEDLEELRIQLREAQETLQAIRSGVVDALVLEESGQHRLYTLETADRPYRLLVERMQQGALVISPHGVILYANPPAAELIGVEASQLGGTMLERHLGFLSRHDLPRQLRETLRAPQARESVLRRPDGMEVPVRLATSLLADEQPARIGVIITDLRAQKRHEALERESDALRTSEGELRVESQRKDEFLATLAHELRNPLGPVHNLLEVLRLKGAPTPDVEWAQNVIQRQVRRISRLVDDLLDLSGIAHDQLAMRRERVLLGPAIEAAVESCDALFSEWGHELVLRLPESPVVLDADPIRLVQIFSNLLQNAANASTRFGRIEVTGTVGEEAVEVEIRDHGAGIASDDLPHVFEMFARANRSYHADQSQLGIGLALVKKLVVLHGGTVEARSDGPGHGSAFIVRLPLAQRTEDGADGPLAAPASHRIMVVDDDMDSADAMAAMLRLYGNAVRSAYDGVRALETGAEFEPNVVLLDLSMPGLDGYEVCRRIRQEEWGHAAHVVAVTGRAQARERDRAIEEGFDHYLVKPVDPADLSALLAELAPRRLTPWPELHSRTESRRVS